FELPLHRGGNERRNEERSNAGRASADELTRGELAARLRAREEQRVRASSGPAQGNERVSPAELAPAIRALSRHTQLDFLHEAAGLPPATFFAREGVDQTAAVGDPNHA